MERGKLSKVRLGSLSLKKEGERQCFLFTKHFLVCTRSSGGKLHLLKVSKGAPIAWQIISEWDLGFILQKNNNVSMFMLQQGGVLSLIDCTLIEEPDNNDEEGEWSWVTLEHAGGPPWLGGALEQWRG